MVDNADKSSAEEQLRQRAANAIRRLLQRTHRYTDGLIPLLTSTEVETIATEGQRSGGAVAIAAIIYRARLRQAGAEAEYHHRVIGETVPFAPRADRKRVGVDGPAIREYGRLS
jgi:hypothetical protein